MKFRYPVALLAASLLCASVFNSSVALASGQSHGDAHATLAAGHASSHAPIGVMGDHTHRAGQLMLSYRFMSMQMEGIRDGGSALSAEKIATTAVNRFAGQPMQPATLRVVPTEMNMAMHMLGLMYAPSDSVTLLAMANYVEKTMDHTTFMGMSGATRLGTFTTKARGIGDTSLAALIKVFGDWHGTLGVSLPTGDLKKTDTILTPMGNTPSPRLPYSMQLGSGTYDAIVGMTYNKGTTHSANSRLGWGGQWRSVLRVGDNSEDYTLGDEHGLTGWLSYSVRSSISLSARIAYFKRENIHGIDSLIVAPVQTADPDRQAVERWDMSAGANWLVPNSRHRLSLEVGLPIAQHLDGPQLETDYQLTVGWQYTP